LFPKSPESTRVAKESKGRFGLPLVPTPRNIRKVMCANRGEIAIRVFRAAHELAYRSVAIYSYEDRFGNHRYKADEAYLVGRGKTPVGAYLAIDDIVEIAKANEVDAIHPGYGFLSEREDFAQAITDAGIIWIGPPPNVIKMMGDKTLARKLAIETGVPVVPGTDGPVATIAEARTFVEKHGLPVIIKAAMGGGGRGMRVVQKMDQLEESFQRATSEALSAFGDGTVFIERYIYKPRHIEVQLLGDETGEVVHLFERDCSVQRRHQKVVEIAPANNLDPKTREALYADAVKLAKAVGYVSAGTAEFLVDQENRYYFIEVNPRIQVEHTVTEEITGVDLVQAQILIAGGLSLRDIGISQETLTMRGHAIQVRVTTEDPQRNFQPDTGRLEAYRSAVGMGIRLDQNAAYAGSVISPHYDSLLVKVTGRGLTFEQCARKLMRAITEFRVRGVKTNIPFLQKLLTHPTFLTGVVSTAFIDENPDLFNFVPTSNRAQRLLYYLGDLIVNGISAVGAIGPPPADIDPIIPSVPDGPPPPGWRQVLLAHGPEGFARAVRKHKGLLIMDTTWRDAHQSLLATRMRTVDLCNIAPATAHALASAYSLEMWGGATFDVALRFLHECPWDRLDKLRALVPNIPFQMLLRGANAVGYTSYPDNVVYKFCEQAKAHGIDIFRVFDALNYMENLKLGIDAVKKCGGVVEAAVCYTGDISDPHRTKYTLDYYMGLVRQLVAYGIHILSIKDMAGLLKPVAAKILISAIRKEFPDLPIHVHTHDTAGTGVAMDVACAEAGADVVDVAFDAMAGMTSQPALGAVVESLKDTEYATGIDFAECSEINDYWEKVREVYAPFESGQKSGNADVYIHEMPGGQYTNLQFQSNQLGLSGQWLAVKRAYHAANHLLGDIIKVTPTSKVVGDLAQFMVTNDLNEEQVLARAQTLSFPKSVVEYMQGLLGIPHYGFPEPFRTHVLKGAQRIDGRPGASMPPLNFDDLKAKLIAKWGEKIRDVDVISASMYPAVFNEYMDFVKQYGDLSVLPTRYFIRPLKVGEEFHFRIDRGVTLYVKLSTVGLLDKQGQREVFFELNGSPRGILITDKTAATTILTRERADTANPGSIGAPMSGVVIELRVRPGQDVKAGDPLAVLSAMKMETVVASTVAGKVSRIPVVVGDSLAAGDLICVIGK